MRYQALVVGVVLACLMMLRSVGYATAWGEDNLFTNPEAVDQSEINDSLLTASQDSRLDALPNSGVGRIANNNDDDWYKLTGYSTSSGEFLKITTDGTRVNLRLRDESYNYLGDAWQGKPLYFQLPDTATTYYLEANRGGDVTYRVTMEKIGSATVSGQLDLLGLVNSTANSLTVYAFDQSGQVAASAWVSDPAGNYSMSVPENVTIYGLGAERAVYHYMGPQPMPADWLYGMTKVLLTSPLTLSAGGSSDHHDFNVYPSAIITGSISPAINVTIQLSDPYSGYSVAYQSNTANAYVFYNIPPGTYDLLVKPEVSGYAPYYCRNIRPVDGQTLTHDITLPSGYTVSGSISPALPMDTTMQLNWTGQGQTGGNAYDHFFSQELSAGQSSYSLAHVPNGTYDLVLGDEGPTSYPVITVTVNGGSVTNADFSTNFNALITGTVTDHTGLFPNLTDLMVIGMAKGQTNVGYAPMYYGGIAGPVANSSATFSIAVPDYNSTYDLMLADFNAEYPILGHSYGWVTGTTDAAITIDANGNSIYGTIAHSSGKNLSVLLKDGPFLMLTRNIGGVDRLVDLVFDSGSNYSTGPFLDSGSNTPYALSIRGFAGLMQEANASRTMTGQNEQVDITFSTDAAKDPASVSIYHLQPVQQQVVSHSRPWIIAKFWDNFLGTGVDSSSIAVQLNGVPVVTAPVAGPENSYYIAFQPSSDLLAVNNPQVVAITAADFSTNPTLVPTAVVTWSFDIATPEPLLTPTPTATLTPQHTTTATPTITATATISATLTQSATYTTTPTISLTPTQSATYTITPTITDTATATATITATSTSTHSATYTATPTVTLTGTPTATNTATPTATQSATASATRTITMTATISPTATNSPTATRTPDNPLIGVDLEEELVLPYPNPARDYVDFLFHFQVATTVHIEIYNMQGERLSTISQQFPAGEGQSLRWVVGVVSPGVYLARVAINGKHETTKKIAIIK